MLSPCCRQNVACRYPTGNSFPSLTTPCSLCYTGSVKMAVNLFAGGAGLGLTLHGDDVPTLLAMSASGAGLTPP